MPCSFAPGTGIQEPVQVFDINTREIPSPFEGVASLYAAIPESAAVRFDWLLALDAEDTARLLAACAGALIDATQGKFADVARLRSADRIARAANLDMRQHWDGGIEFFGRLTKKAMLAALTEACSPNAAENCAKLDKQALAIACAERIPGRGWLPPALVTPPVPEQGIMPEPQTETEESDEADEEPIYGIAAE